ncbi:MAG: LysR family transcriptional regulator [Pseudomonadota bacterium]
MHSYLRHMANFARIVEAGSLKAASDLLGTAPSGLSDSVRILENRIGSPLLVRHRRGVYPTSEGEKLFAAASEIVDLLDQAIGEASAEAEKPLRFSLPGEVAQTVFAKALAWLGANAPDVAVSVVVEDEIVDATRFGRDYFLRVGAGLQTPNGLREVWQKPALAILVAMPELAASPKDIANLALISGPNNKSHRSIRLSSPSQTISFARSIQVSDPTTRLAFAKQGLGATTCLDFCAAEDIKSGGLVRLFPDRLGWPVKVSLLTPHRRPSRRDDMAVGACEAIWPVS